MSRALVTLAAGGTYRRLLDISRPSLQRFAAAHRYDYVEVEIDCDRAPSWWKVPALKAALEEYDEALWVDADVVVVDASQDLRVPEGMWQALVRHRTGDGDVPNCGVWLVREPMRPILDQIWATTSRLDHGWWEQAALMDLLGWQVKPPARQVTETILAERTHWLGAEWNVHKWQTPGPEKARFMHATMHDDREEVMADWAAGNVPDPSTAACRHRYPIDDCVCGRVPAAV